MSARRALVIEHGMEVQDFLFSSTAHSWQVRLTRSPELALSVLRRGAQFDLVAVEEGPEDGHRLWQSLRRLAQASGSTPVLLFTDSTARTKHARAAEAGLAGLIVKPTLVREGATTSTEGSAAAGSADAVADSR